MKTETLIDQVVIVGGIHGNELTGIYLVKKFEKYPYLIQRNHLQVTTLLGNPRAIAARTRYIEKDLNRCFYLLNSDHANFNSSSYEERRAREIQTQLNPKSSSSIPLILDLHSTTANMGLIPIQLELAINKPFRNEELKPLLQCSFTQNWYNLNFGKLPSPDFAACSGVGCEQSTRSSVQLF